MQTEILAASKAGTHTNATSHATTKIATSKTTPLPVTSQSSKSSVALTAHLYYQQGSSDKEYHVQIVSIIGGYRVDFGYGRRGGTLTTGSKTYAPLAYEQAKEVFDKLVQSKLAKGYQAEDNDTTPKSPADYQHPALPAANQPYHTDFIPQLCNPIDEVMFMQLLNDDAWAVQQKMDGERRAVHAEVHISQSRTGTKHNHAVFGFNRKGLVVALPLPIADELQQIANVTGGAIRVDGELVGEILHVFDLLIYQGNALQTTSWLKRMRLASLALKDCQHIKAVPVAMGKSAKKNLVEKILFENGEGMVLKRTKGLINPGRPNSGGDWLKFKFIESASCYVTAINQGKRSVKLGLLDADTELLSGTVHLQSNDPVLKTAMIHVGNVTIPPNYDVPAVGDIVEVEYLYAYRGGCLYQSVYRGKRTDIELSACNFAQLKYKPE